MTIEEAIKHCEEVAWELDKKAMCVEEAYQTAEQQNCEQCAAEHRQLAAWLEELKERREDALQTTKRGKWISKVNMEYVDKNKIEHHHGMCSECELIYDFVDLAKWFRFCPNCGADMRGEKNESDN